ncbi:MAG: hypothetical protein ACYTG0_23900 [Planctomycetota bacterium]|jgi:hypothetical protein
MEARILRGPLLVITLIASMGASYRTPNFTIRTTSQRLAEQFGKAAERYRRDLAVLWLGKPMPKWSRPCVVTARVSPNLGAGGETTFAFDRGEVYGWQMTIQGSAERIFDSVLPHEITHTIFACHFRQPLPRWADEGGATSVEHPSERAKHRKMLIDFLRTKRGIAFDRMLPMMKYPCDPCDMLPLYAQGYTLADFLIQRAGRKQFLEFLAEGIQHERCTAATWSAAISRHYGYRNATVLQNAWLAWVRHGFPKIRSTEPANPAPAAEMVAGVDRRRRPEPNLLHRIEGRASARSSSTARIASQTSSDGQPGPQSLAASSGPTGQLGTRSTQVLPTSGWRAAGDHTNRAATAVAAVPSPVETVRTQVARPQPIQRPRQIVLEWSRP